MLVSTVMKHKKFRSCDGVLGEVLYGWAGSNVFARTFDPFSLLNRGVILIAEQRYGLTSHGASLA